MTVEEKLEWQAILIGGLELVRECKGRDFLSLMHLNSLKGWSCNKDVLVLKFEVIIIKWFHFIF
jgi:hypothetical protein